MIARLTGKLAETTAEGAVIDVARRRLSTAV